MVGGSAGGLKPTLRRIAGVICATEGRARPRGGARPLEVATLSSRGSRQVNRRANGDEAPARGGGRALPGGTACLDSGLGADVEPWCGSMR